MDGSEKHELTEEAHRIIKTIKQMEASLEDQKPNGTHRLEDEQIKVAVPLKRCVSSLKEKHNTIARLHAERFEQVKSELLHGKMARPRYSANVSRTCTSA